LAAATSTGGMTNKRWQRIGDSPVPGAGTYANNATCAISCTGNGEAFLRAVAAHDVHALMAYKGLSLAEAVHVVVHEKLPPLDGEGGLIAVDHHGRVVLDFCSSGMYRAKIDAAGEEAAIFWAPPPFTPADRSCFPWGPFRARRASLHALTLSRVQN